jgi:hypothetical protein
MLSGTAEIITIVGFPLALAGILLAWLDGRHSRDLDAALVIADSFTDRWSPEVKLAIAAINDSQQRRVPPPTEKVDVVINALDWLDSVGLMIGSNLLARPDRVVRPIKRVLISRLESVGFIITTTDARERWRGVWILVRTLGLSETDLLPGPPPQSDMSRPPAN